jgi:hypothetical protein
VKPLPAAAWTKEDTDIWVNVLERCGLYWYATTLEWFQGQDRRDAELMLRAQHITNRDWSYVRLDSWNAATWSVAPEVVAPGTGWYLVRRGRLTNCA